MPATSNSTALLPFQPSSMSQARLAAISYLARYSGATHHLYAAQLRRWFSWCETNEMDPLTWIQRAHVELYIRHLTKVGLMDSSVNTMMHAVRGYFRFAHIDGIIGSDPAVYARLPKIHRDESRTQGLDRLELIRFLQVAQTITVHHGALAYLLGINALRASEAAAVRIDDCTDHLRGHRVLRLVGKGNKPATMPLTVPVLRVLEACRGQRTAGPLVLRPLTGKPIDRRDVYRMVQRIAKSAQIPRDISPHSLRHAAITNALDAGVALRDAQILAGTQTPEPPSTTTEPAATSTATASTSSPPTSPACKPIRDYGPTQWRLSVAESLATPTSVDYSRHVVEVFATADFDQWLRKLKDRQGRLRILARLDRLAHGNPGDVKTVGRGILELRLTYGPGYRVYYTQRGNQVVLLLCGGDKSTQQKDIAKAHQLAAHWHSKEDGDNG